MENYKQNAVLQQAHNFVITNNNDLYEAGALLQRIKGYKEMIMAETEDDVKDAFIKHKVAVAARNAQLKSWQDVDDVLRQDIMRYHQQTGEQTENLTFIEKYTYEIVDEKLVPSYYFSIDQAKIKKDVTKRGNLFHCPGIKVVPLTELRIRGGG